jgi:hypothetical protein
MPTWEPTTKNGFSASISHARASRSHRPARVSARASSRDSTRMDGRLDFLAAGAKEKRHRPAWRSKCELHGEAHGVRHVLGIEVASPGRERLGRSERVVPRLRSCPSPARPWPPGKRQQQRPRDPSRRCRCCSTHSGCRRGCRRRTRDCGLAIV